MITFLFFLFDLIFALIYNHYFTGSILDFTSKLMVIEGGFLFVMFAILATINLHNGLYSGKNNSKEKEMYSYDLYIRKRETSILLSAIFLIGSGFLLDILLQSL